LYAMVANAPSEEEMSSAKVRIVWTMVHNTEINELLDIFGLLFALQVNRAAELGSGRRAP